MKCIMKRSMVLRDHASLFALRSTAAAFSSAQTTFCASLHVGGAPPSPAGAYGRSM